MTVSYRAADAPASTPAVTQPVKVTRLGCCCKLSDLLPIVKQLHEKTRTRHAADRPEAA